MNAGFGLPPLAAFKPNTAAIISKIAEITNTIPNTSKADVTTTAASAGFASVPNV